MDDLEKLLIVSIGQLMIGKEYPNVGQIVDKISPLIASYSREARIDELKRAASNNNSEYTSDYLEERIKNLSEVDDE